ncbi:hypothetical protein GOP47_0011491 [Adiantum capillus-veneris]|uniref:Uncharacterized protein n=1 Tax=Adiantum capillus-veneris TaxID=13818 RepID=A0A9D4ZFG4_ADICA|nr:hypothetical protein GOP47_0011491 [Adiantum capillus-veneris]
MWRDFDLQPNPSFSVVMEEGEEEEEEEEEEEDEDEEEEILKPKKRIGRPPKVWSSILLPKEVTSTLGTRKPRLAKSQKANNSAKSSNSNEGEATYSKVSPSNMVGQTVHGVVDGCFDAGFLVSLRMGDSDSLYRGVVFGPGLSIPVSKETDIAKNVKRRRRKRKQPGTTATSREEPSTPPPLPTPPTREEALPSNPALTQPPQHYEAPPLAQHSHHPNSAPHALENPHISPPIPPQPHPHQFAFNGAMHANNFRSPRPHPEMGVNPFMHSSSFPPRPTMSMPPAAMPPAAQGYSPRQNFGHVLPSPSTPYGYNFAGAQGRPICYIGYLKKR